MKKLISLVIGILVICVSVSVYAFAPGTETNSGFSGAEHQVMIDNQYDEAAPGTETNSG